MSKVVLDASVLIAVIRNEHMDDAVIAVLEGAYVSAVNFAETLTFLAEHASGSSPHAPSIFSVLQPVEPFTAEQAETAASLRSHTKAAGLSLGDRACIALALELDADVYTADRAWAKVKLPCRVHLIR